MIKQGTARKIFIYLANASSPTTGLTGITFSGADIRLSKDGGALANCAYTAQGPLGDGLYWVTLSSTETNLSLAEGDTGDLAVFVNVAGAVPNQVMVFTVANKGFGDLTAVERTAIATAVAAPSAATIAAAVAAAVPDIGDITAVVPTLNDIAAAVIAEDAGDLPLGETITLIARYLLAKATLPMTSAGGPFTIRDLGDTKDAIVGTISSGGVRDFTTRDGA